jgi:Zn-finger nucleic acid-binding protein
MRHFNRNPQNHKMKCPSCKTPLREKGAGGMTLDVCYGGCGGIWFDAKELERVSARAATTLHTIWNVPVSDVTLTDPRICPRCAGQVLERKWFSKLQQVEIDECPNCAGVWLDAGEFSRVYDESKRAKVTSPLWMAALTVFAKESRNPPPSSPHV